MANSDVPELVGKLRRKNKIGLWTKCYCELHITQFTLRHHRKNPRNDIEIQISHNTRIRYLEEKSGNHIIIETGNKENTVTLASRTNNEEDIVKWLLALRSATFYNPHLNMNNFKIITVLGRGCFGKVMLVQKNGTKEIHAIKTVRKQVLIQSKKVHTILAERNILVGTHHPFIVEMLFAFQSATKFYIGLEYVPGGELFGLINREKRLPLDQVRIYIAEISLALRHLHRLGIVYRDLKPENILIAADGHIKLTDFGLSKDISLSRMTKSFCGTPDFMPPEIVNQQLYSYQVDWWSLGILTFMLLFGETPFYDENRSKMFAKINMEDPPFPPGADPIAVDFISQLLTKDFSKRPGLDELQNHPFFGGIPMDDFLAKKIQPKFIPTINDPLDARNFDVEFTAEAPVDSTAEVPLQEGSGFHGFSFIAKQDEMTVVNEMLH